jgi:ribosomal protein S18 acetylase RimI-like enzyme
VIVREARPEEDARIGDLLVDAFLTVYARKMPEVRYDDARKNELRDVASKRGRAVVLVAEVDGHVAGTVSLFKPGAQGSEAWLPNAADLRHLAVDPRLHGQGVAKPLLDRAEAIARDDWKVPAICLHVRRGADGVARLYRSRGFVREPAGDLVKPAVTLEAYVLRFQRTR